MRRRTCAIEWLVIGLLVIVMSSFYSCGTQETDKVEGQVHKDTINAEIKAVLFSHTEREEEKLHRIDELLRRFPEDVSLLSAKVLLLVQMGDYQEAISVVDVLLGKKPGVPEYYVYKGMLLELKGKEEQAHTWYVKGKELLLQRIRSEDDPLLQVMDEGNLLYVKKLLREEDIVDFYQTVLQHIEEEVVDEELKRGLEQHVRFVYSTPRDELVSILVLGEGAGP